MFSECVFLAGPLPAGGLRQLSPVAFFLAIAVGSFIGKLPMSQLRLNNALQADAFQTGGCLFLRI
jgi:hypothetical protein